MDLFPGLVEQLSAQTSIAEELLSLLEQEPTVLASRDHHDIVDLSRHKQYLAEKLAEEENKRCHYLETAGLPTDLLLLETALREAGAETAATACQNLKQSAAACAEHNRNNGILVENRLRHVARALEIVTGQSSETTEITYGAQSKRLGRGNGRSWAKV
ncbi:flagella synthesis protein FlgN [Gammaproteobacteria bacterium]